MRLTAASLAALLFLAACWGSGSEPPPPSPEEGVTVRVVNRSGEFISVGYTFARTEPSTLGGVPRMAEGVFTFAYEPGSLEFIIDLPQGQLTSNRTSTRVGDRLVLEVDSRQARVRRDEGEG